MSGSPVGAAVTDRARAAVATARAAEHAVLEAVAALESLGVAEATGYRSTERLLQDLVRVDLGEARRLVGHSRLLCARSTAVGEPLPPSLAATAPAAAAGGLDRGHVAVIARAVRYLQQVDDIDPAAITEAEEFLVGHAASLTPRGLARVAARLIAALDPDGVAPDEESGSGDELRIGRRRDGSLVLKGRFRGRADIELLQEAFDALSGRAGPDDHRALEERYAAALLEMAAQACEPGGIAADTPAEHHARPEETTAPTEPGAPDPRFAAHARDDLADAAAPGATPGATDGTDGTDARDSADAPEARPRARAPGRPLLTVTIPLPWLQARIGHATLVDPEYPISAAEARRLACDAGIVPMVLGARGDPLDVGRLSYSAPDAIRRALVQRDQGCAFPGCTRRPRRCHAHHVLEWGDDGHTAVENMCLLCGFHHRLVHAGDWTVAMIDGRPWFTPPSFIDPDRQPRPGGAFLV